jgi:hypothetical protein
MKEIFITYEKTSWSSGRKNSRVEFKLQSATLNHPLNRIFGCGYDVFKVPEIQSSIVYVVVVTYDTGGTFSTVYDERGIEGVYFSAKEAEEIKTTIYNKTYNEKYGKFCFWEGYFEKLKNVEIGTLTIQEVAEEEKKKSEQLKEDFQTFLEYFRAQGENLTDSKIRAILLRYQ